MFLASDDAMDRVSYAFEGLLIVAAAAFTYVGRRLDNILPPLPRDALDDMPAELDDEVRLSPIEMADVTGFIWGPPS